MRPQGRQVPILAGLVGNDRDLDFILRAAEADLSFRRISFSNFSKEK